MRLTLTRKKFISLSVATIVLAQGGHALMFAGPPAKAAPGASGPKVAPIPVAVDQPLDLEPASIAFELIADEIGFAESFGLETLWGTATATAGQCVSSASNNGSPVWVSNTADPNYATFRFPFQFTCTQPAGATTGCEPFVFVSVTYKWVGGTWTSIYTYYTPTDPQSCNTTTYPVVYSRPNTIDIVTGPNGGTGSYRSQMFVYKQSDFIANNWGAWLAYNYYDWTY